MIGVKLPRHTSIDCQSLCFNMSLTYVCTPSKNVACRLHVDSSGPMNMPRPEELLHQVLGISEYLTSHPSFHASLLSQFRSCSCPCVRDTVFAFRILH